MLVYGAEKEIAVCNQGVLCDGLLTAIVIVEDILSFVGPKEAVHILSRAG